MRAGNECRGMAQPPELFALLKQDSFNWEDSRGLHSTESDLKHSTFQYLGRNFAGDFAQHVAPLPAAIIRFWQLSFWR